MNSLKVIAAFTLLFLCSQKSFANRISKIEFNFYGDQVGRFSMECAATIKENILKLNDIIYPHRREEIFRESPTTCQITNHGPGKLTAEIKFESAENKQVIAKMELQNGATHTYNFDGQVAVEKDPRMEMVGKTNNEIPNFGPMRHQSFQGQSYDPMNTHQDLSLIGK